MLSVVIRVKGGRAISSAICSSIRDADQQAWYTRGGQLLLGDPDAGHCCAGEPWAFPTTGSPLLLSWDGEKGQLRALLMRGS